MNVWICVLIVGLVVVIAALLLKIYLMKKSAKEIRIAFAKKVEEDTNTLIHISSRDADMRELASAINIQLGLLNQSRQRFEHGDLELKEAITNISHDLRTPLTAIYGYLKLFENEECSETGRISCGHRKSYTGVKTAYRRAVSLYHVGIGCRGHGFRDRIFE